MTAASLAFETSGRYGSIALGIDGELIETANLPRKKRHNLELMPAVAALCDKHQLEPADLGELYTSLGPGSFTGLRIAIATAKMLSLTNPALKLVGVPTIDVLAEQFKDAAEHVAVCMNIKRGTMYAGVYRDGQPILEPALRSAEALLEQSPRSLAIVAEVDTGIEPDEGVTIVDRSAIEADAAVTWRLGKNRAGEGRFTAPADLLPLYVREPEAVTLWNDLGRD
ncbi:MAG: tRNA (adenosine(37)-N6)-threonylcarbamoyltransferase complex dimerization subunit type 1 TsaB [Phycisphaeraceae bacterium]